MRYLQKLSEKCGLNHLEYRAQRLFTGKKNKKSLAFSIFQCKKNIN
jgi:hypothetical protein